MSPPPTPYSFRYGVMLLAFLSTVVVSHGASALEFLSQTEVVDNIYKPSNERVRVIAEDEELCNPDLPPTMPLLDDDHLPFVRGVSHNEKSAVDRDVHIGLFVGGSDFVSPDFPQYAARKGVPPGPLAAWPNREEGGSNKGFEPVWASTSSESIFERLAQPRAAVGSAARRLSAIDDAFWHFRRPACAAAAPVPQDAVEPLWFAESDLLPRYRFKIDWFRMTKPRYFQHILSLRQAADPGDRAKAFEEEEEDFGFVDLDENGTVQSPVLQNAVFDDFLNADPDLERVTSYNVGNFECDQDADLVGGARTDFWVAVVVAVPILSDDRVTFAQDVGTEIQENLRILSTTTDIAKKLYEFLWWADYLANSEDEGEVIQAHVGKRFLESAETVYGQQEGGERSAAGRRFLVEQHALLMSGTTTADPSSALLENWFTPQQPSTSGDHDRSVTGIFDGSAQYIWSALMKDEHVLEPVKMFTGATGRSGEGKIERFFVETETVKALQETIPSSWSHRHSVDLEAAKEIPVQINTIAGKLRSGKSFLIDRTLRQLVGGKAFGAAHSKRLRTSAQPEGFTKVSTTFSTGVKNKEDIAHPHLFLSITYFVRVFVLV